MLTIWEQIESQRVDVDDEERMNFRMNELDGARVLRKVKAEICPGRSFARCVIRLLGTPGDVLGLHQPPPPAAIAVRRSKCPLRPSLTM
jgi:hypothetical protein